MLFQDIYVGLLFSSLLLAFVLPLVESTDNLLMSHPAAPIVTTMLTLLAIVYYPGSDRYGEKQHLHKF